MATCNCERLPVTNSEIDSVVCSQDGTTAFWKIENPATARLVRGRIYYSARIHGREVTTRYKGDTLQVSVIA